jgi:quercetin dioxygenase-like cupin family protein
MADLDLCMDGDVFVEVNGVVHEVHEVQDTSQGTILIVDPDQEDRDMRVVMEEIEDDVEE